jgi:hypothetical protein
MITINLFLMVLALVLLLCAAVRVPEPSRVSFGWLGMFCWLLSLILTK